MTDTAQPMAAETDAIADAASAFKIALGQDEAQPQRDRDEQGRFVSAQPEDAEAQQEPEPLPEIEEAAEAELDPEAAEEAQPEGHAMPTSWAKEDEEAWSALPAEVQAKVAEREAQRDHAVNQKFQEAANARKEGETARNAASQVRTEVIHAYTQAMALLVPQEPPTSMLDRSSSDYNPDHYHLLKAQQAESMQLLEALSEQRQQFIAQEAAEEERADSARFQAINEATRDAFIRDVPDFTDRAKAPEVLRELMEYAVSQGFPPETFSGPTTAGEFHMLWKAREYDRQREARAKARATAPPPKKPRPPVRPGVTTPRSTIERQSMQRDFDRLRKSGSIEDGAAVFKHFLKG